jgi:hypothetical protein
MFSLAIALALLFTRLLCFSAIRTIGHHLGCEAGDLSTHIELKSGAASSLATQAQDLVDTVEVFNLAQGHKVLNAPVLHRSCHKHHTIRAILAHRNSALSPSASMLLRQKHQPINQHQVKQQRHRQSDLPQRRGVALHQRRALGDVQGA